MKVELYAWSVVIEVHPLKWWLIPVACHNYSGDGAAPIHHRRFWRAADWYHTELSILCFTFDITK